MTPELRQKNRKIALTILGVVVTMVAMSYAFVPLYDLFCRMTGFGGTPLLASDAPGAVEGHPITVKFNASTARGMGWDFAPEQRAVTLDLGEKALIAYRAVNTGRETVTGTSLYNVSPPSAGKYFHKIECFCFAEQTLKPQETAHFPVSFYIDPALADDPDLADLTTITLSYTFFKVNSSALDKALEDFYNQ